MRSSGLSSAVIRNAIINLLIREINNTNSDLYKIVKRKTTDISSEKLAEDNKNDINWDELDELFGDYLPFIEMNTNNEFMLVVDEQKLTPGVNYTVKYIDKDSKPIESYEAITKFTI